MPWYVIWLLPLAALGASLRLRRVAAGLTVYLVLVFMPTTGILLGLANINPMNTPAGHASIKLQTKLER